MTSIRRFGWTTLALIALVGCEAGTTSTPTPSTPPVIKPLPVDPPKTEEPKKETDATKLSDEEIAEIKKLPAEDQKIALAQMVCPVSGDHLGEANMGAPIKQVVDGKTFFLCCAGCEKEVKADPKGVLAKLKK
jgi:YHS domain-containing protein